MIDPKVKLPDGTWVRFIDSGDEVLERHYVRMIEQRIREIDVELRHLRREQETAAKGAERAAAQLARHHHLFEDELNDWRDDTSAPTSR